MAATHRKTDTIDIKGILSSFRSKWYLFAISAVVCVCLGFLVSRIYHRPMAVRANVLITDENDQFAGSTGGGSGLASLFNTSANVQDEVFVIASHTLYRNVAKALGINRDHYVRTSFMRDELSYPEWPVDVTSTPAMADTLSQALTFKIKVNDKGVANITVKGKKNRTVAKVKDASLPATVATPYGDFTVTTTPAFIKGQPLKTTVVYYSYEMVAEKLGKVIEADLASRKSNMINLSFDTPYPVYGVDVLNTVLEKYNERGISDKNRQGEKTARFLEDRITLMGADLAASEDAIQQFKERNRINDLSAEAAYQASKRSLLDNSALELESELEMLKVTRAFMADSINKTELVPVNVNSLAIATAINNYNNLVSSRVEMYRETGPDHRNVRRLEERMEMVRKSILANIDQAVTATRTRLAEVKAEAGANNGSMGRVPTLERQYVEMKRQQEMRQQLYMFLLQRKEENSMMLANAISKGKVIDEAYVLGDPLGLSTKMILAIALLIGLCIPPAYLYVRKLTLDRLERRRELEQRTDVPVLGEMCTDRSGRSLVVTEHDTSSATELFRLMRSNLQFILSPAAGDKVVLVTSTKSGEGKSFIATNLAASLALQHGKRVLLVGMDIRNPQLENYLDMHPRWGLTNYLAGASCTVDDLINPVPGAKDLDAIVAGPIPPNPAELLMGTALDTLFDTLRARYDYIVIDSAPVGMVSDTFTLDRLADAVVYVTRLGHTTLTDVDFIDEIHTQNRLKKLSLVINGTHSRKGYGYGYSAAQARNSRHRKG